MKTKLNKLWCYLFGHKYRHISVGVLMTEWELVECVFCKKQMILNHTMESAIEADDELISAMDGK